MKTNPDINQNMAKEPFSYYNPNSQHLDFATNANDIIRGLVNPDLPGDIHDRMRQSLTQSLGVNTSQLHNPYTLNSNQPPQQLQIGKNVQSHNLQTVPKSSRLLGFIHSKETSDTGRNVSQFNQPYITSNKSQGYPPIHDMNYSTYHTQAFNTAKVEDNTPPQLGKVAINSEAEVNPEKPLAAVKQSSIDSMPPYIYGPAIQELKSDTISGNLYNTAQFLSQDEFPTSSGEAHSNTSRSRSKGKGKEMARRSDMHAEQVTMGGSTNSYTATQQESKSTMIGNMNSSSKATQASQATKPAASGNPYMATQADVETTFPSYKQPKNRSRNAAGNSKQLSSGQAVINQQFGRYQQYNKHNQVDRSPFIPKTLGELQAHNSEYKKCKNEEEVKVLKDRITQRTREAEGTLVKIMPAFGGKKFTDGRSAVLGLETIFTAWPDSYVELSEEDRAEAKKLGIEWPSLQERKQFGEKMIAAGKARELPPPRYNELNQRHMCWLIDEGVEPSHVLQLDSNEGWKDMPWEFRRICLRNGLDEVDFERNEILRAKNAADAANGLPFNSDTAFRGMTPAVRKEWEQWIEADRIRKHWEAEMQKHEPEFKGPVRFFEAPDPAVEVDEEEGMHMMGGAMMAAFDA